MDILRIIYKYRINEEVVVTSITETSCRIFDDNSITKLETDGYIKNYINSDIIYFNCDYKDFMKKEKSSYYYIKLTIMDYIRNRNISKILT